MLEKDYAGFAVDNRPGGVCILTLNRPERMNGLDWAMKRDLIEALTQLSYDDNARVVVITGGESFCAGDNFQHKGGDMWASARSQPVHRERRDALATYNSLRTISQTLNRSLRNLDKLTIAAIDGVAIQSGLSLALACDFRFATARAKLGSATLRMGYLPDEGGHYFLVELLGPSRTKDFLFRKRIVSGTEALDLGLVNELVEPDRLLPHAIAFAEELAAGPQVAMHLLKHGIDNAAHMTFEDSCMDMALRAAISDHHPDAKEGPAAFSAKPRRNPRFNQDRGVASRRGD